MFEFVIEVPVVLVLNTFAKDPRAGLAVGWQVVAAAVAGLQNQAVPFQPFTFACDNLRKEGAVDVLLLDCVENGFGSAEIRISQVLSVQTQERPLLEPQYA